MIKPKIRARLYSVGLMAIPFSFSYFSNLIQAWVHGCLGSEQDMPQYLVERDAPGSSHGPTFEADTKSRSEFGRNGCCIFVARLGHDSGARALT